jgi:hypothetical protein
MVRMVKRSASPAPRAMARSRRLSLPPVRSRRWSPGKLSAARRSVATASSTASSRPCGSVDRNDDRSSHGAASPSNDTGRPGPNRTMVPAGSSRTPR